MKLREVALAVMLLTSLPAHALFDDDEARRRIDVLRQETDARLQKLEAAAETNSRAVLTLNAQLEDARQQVAQIRGQIELLTNDNDQGQKRQKDFYVDLDARLRKLESGLQPAQAAPGADQSAAAENRPADPAQEARDYEAAINLLRAGKHADAIGAFKKFIQNWPRSNFQSGAHFWAAAAMAQTKDYAGAKEYYARLVQNWPDDAMAPDALLGQATVEQSAGAARSARATLEKLIASYPNSDAAKTARQRLKK